MPELTEIWWLIYELPSPGPAFYITLSIGLLMAFFLRKARRNYLRLPEIPRVPAAGPLDVTVVIPARNEAANIARAVGSFRPAGLRVIVVDDSSDDDTQHQAALAGAEVIAAPPLRPGALGKPNACQAGADAAATKWILFVDADTWYHPDFAASIVARAEAENLALVSCFPRQVCLTWAERILVPYAFALYFCGVSGRRVNSIAAGDTLANGQCMLFRRDAYQFVGGHGAVASSLIEDMALAARVKRHRMNATVGRAEHLAKVRMYSGYAGIREGFRRNSFRYLLMNPATGFQIVAASLVLTLYLPLVVYLLWGAHWWYAFSITLLIPYLLAPWYGSVGRALLALPAIYGFQRIAIGSTISTSFGRRMRWKGREV